MIQSGYLIIQEDNMPIAKQLQGDKSDWGGARTGAGRPAGSRLEPGERAQVVSFTLSPGLVKKLKEHADKEGKSRSMIVEAALKNFFLAGA
jgi:hypothetical protein